MASISQSQLRSFKAALKEAKKPVALAGAGLSAASGIPTFRGAGGLWREHDALSLATPEAFSMDPSKVWQFYHYRRETCLRASPNSAHRCLAKLLSPSQRSKYLPSSGSLHLITQNVDGLSARAGTEIGEDHVTSGGILEMHGSLFRTVCTSCNDVRPNFESPISEGLRGTEDPSLEYRETPLEGLPRCENLTRWSRSIQPCRGLLRPGVVWFGESIPALDEIYEILEGCDLIMVLGTSSTVYPAAGFAGQVKMNGGRVAVFNLECGPQDRIHADWLFQGAVEELLPLALGIETQ
ncbi:DHS-like NAD/FAD-binding domain-containing protein [Violaceomyces palustris]|uniref:DHS-like NAD/FAD-binding domain-containing protein n=1 Tax=Violaceomyces palustris TaxID=1673888 RepID=A0ACD0NXJ3_9BASI|nr:DHS-like NAD/FAD-binding domain-containing protein [Violaceomyces palustris]